MTAKVRVHLKNPEILAMFCYNCGQQMEEGATFCTQCGTPAAVVSGAAAPAASAPEPVVLTPTGNAAEDALRYKIPADRVTFLLNAFAWIRTGCAHSVVIPNSRWRAPTNMQFKYCEDNGFGLTQIQGQNGWFVVAKR